MIINSVEQHSRKQLINKLRKVSMLLRPDVYPYAEAEIDLVTLDPELIAPPQRYVLAPELMKVQSLQWALLKHDIDLFNLDGYVSIMVNGSDEVIDVLPPIVEYSTEANGKKVSIAFLTTSSTTVTSTLPSVMLVDLERYNSVVLNAPASKWEYFLYKNFRNQSGAVSCHFSLF